MNLENLFVNELVVTLNSDHCHKKSKGNIHFNILKETRKMTFNLVIICLFICISKCTSFWIHTESGNIENGCHFPSFEYESFVISSAWDLFSFCSDVTQVTSKWWQEILLLRFRIQRPCVVYLITFTYSSRLVINDVSPGKKKSMIDSIYNQIWILILNLFLKRKVR